jgi:M6 family metalloprotease-like protein
VTARQRSVNLLLAATACLAALAPAPAAARPRPYTGTLEIRHADDFQHGRSITTYALLRRGHRIALSLTGIPRVPSGVAVIVEGRRAGSRLKGSLRPAHALARAAGVGAGPRKTAVILVTFAGTAPPWTTDLVRQRVFTDSNSTNAYYREDSYGDVSLVGKLRTDGDVFGWYTIPAPVADSRWGCNVNSIASDAEAAAAADGFVSAGYQHVIYAFPTQRMCSWAGLGEMPGTHSWINGFITNVAVVAHELGHNMGLNHASSLTCTDGGTPVTIGPTCTKQEYGDPFDVMGNSSHRNNAWHLRQIGFMPAGNMQTVVSDGTYTLTSTSSRGGTQLLRVRRPTGSSPPYYDLELRSAGGVFDNFLSTDPAVQGVTIHTNPDPATVTQSLLLDTTPGSSSGFADAPLGVGRTFTDDAVSITVQSISARTATVVVTSGPPPPDTTPPSVPGPVTATVGVDRVGLSWPAAGDNVGVAGYRVFRDAAQVATTTATSWVDLAVSPATTYRYTVRAFDAAGNFADSAPVSATVPAPPPPPTPTAAPPTSTPPGSSPPSDHPVLTVDPPFPPADTTRPSVTIASPARRAHLRRRAMVRASAADAVGVVRTEVWVDGARRKSVTGSAVAWRWPLRHARRGLHLIVVRALDAAGNVGRAAVRVRVSR